MKIETINALATYCPALNNLTDEFKSTISELIFCHRSGRFSVVICSNSKDDFLDLVGNMPDEIKKTNVSRYAVDLHSMETDTVRIYLGSNDTGVSIVGYNIDKEGAIIEKKIYKRTDDRKTLNIDRYNDAGILISPDEVEIECGERDWTGPVEIVSVAKSHDLNMIFLKKVAKNQSYVRLRDTNKYGY